VIAEFRQGVAALLDSQRLLPLHRYLPDDVAELPCIVVGPVSVDDGEPGLFELQLDVFVCGRRLGDDDSQIELDDYADDVVTILGGTQGRQLFSVTSATPQLVTVSGVEIPTYAITVETTVHNC
jgi:hypothetical protein